MRFFKLLFLAVVCISLLLLGRATAEAAFNPYRPLCVGIQGKFTAVNWKGGDIQVGCVGDDGGATNQADQRCTGEVQTVKAGKEFRLTKCSCWGSNKGCLKVGKELKLNPLNSNNRRTITIVKNLKDMTVFKQNDCRHTDLRPYCAANGAHITGNIKITCDAPPTNTPTKKPTSTPTPTRNPSHTPTPTLPVTNTPTPTEAICVDPDRVTNVEVTCTNCSPSDQQDN